MAAPLPLDVEDFLVWLSTERGRSENTLAAYRRDLRRYHGWLTERGSDVLTVDTRTITDFVAAADRYPVFRLET